MFQPLHTGAAGLTSQQRNMDVIGNNVANVNTQGYKRTRLDFQDNLYTRMWNYEDNSPYMNLQRGTGVRTYQNTRLFEQGALQSTERALDFALEGAGFFVYQNPNEEYTEDGDPVYHYSRAGTLYLTEDPDFPEGPSYLVDAQGRYILNTEGERITVRDPQSLTCNSQGVLSCLNEDGEIEEFAQLWVTDFVNPGGLNDIGGGYFTISDNCGEELETVNAKVLQYTTESSNVDLANEMTRLIRAQRSYQIASRCVSTADQMMQVANNLRA